MIELETGWTLSVERGPDWLFVKLYCDDETVQDVPPLAERIWEIYQQHFVHRLVLECEGVKRLHSRLLAELIALHRRVKRQGGVMRVSGLSPLNQDVLHAAHLDNYLHSYATRADAVLAGRPQQPR